MIRQRLAALVLAMTGPIAHADPVFALDSWLTDESAADDVSLEGSWRGNIGCVDFTVSPSGSHVYHARVGDCRGATDYELVVELHKLDGRYLLVAGPAERREQLLLMPVYWLLGLELDGETLKVFDVDDESFELRIAASTIEIRGRVVLSETEELVEFLSWQVGDPAFFEPQPSFVFTRVETEE